MLALRVIHVVFAAAWFGHKLLIPADLRTSLAGGEGDARGLLVRLRHAERLGIATGLGTLATGLGLTAVIGWGSVPGATYVALALVLAAVALGASTARPAGMRLRVAVDEGRLGDARAAARPVQRVLAGESFLWGGALVSMLL